MTVIFKPKAIPEKIQRIVKPDTLAVVTTYGTFYGIKTKKDAEWAIEKHKIEPYSLEDKLIKLNQ